MLELTYFKVFLIVIGAMFFGYYFGLFEGRAQGRKKGKEEEAEKPAPMPVVKTIDDPGVLRLKVEDGAYRLDMDGARVNTTLPLQPEQKKRLIDLLTVMRPWLEGKSAPAPSQTPPPASFSGTAAPAQQTYSAPAASPASFMQVEQTPSVEPVPARLDFGKLLSPKKKEEKPAEAQMTMVQQIDSILQTKIANTPFARIGLKLEESADGGVLVKIGERAFQGVGDVPDPQVKAVIQSAITDWEKKYTPGL
jgi:hypothetical protein